MRLPIAAVTLTVALAAPVLGQWPKPPEDTPKAADGKPNLGAPAPRTPDGKPDLSGVWELVRPPGGERGRGGTQPAPPPPPSDGPPLSTFANIGANFKDGLPLQPWAADLLKRRHEENSKDNPDAHCLPMGLMQFHMHPQPRKIIQTPKEVVIIYEANFGLRQIYLDGRSLPGKDAEPWWFGYSVGHWDGDTLVVETTGYRDDVWLDIWGTPMTSAARTIERFRRVNYGSMQIDVTIDDPKAFTKPFTVRVNHRLAPDEELIEFICQDRDAPHMVGK